MFDSASIITRLETETRYTVERLKDKQISLSKTVELPLIYVGFASLDSDDPSIPGALNNYDQHGEDLIQAFDIQIVCLEDELVTVWRAIHTAIIGWNPQPLEEQFSGFTYKQGGMIGLENGRLWWLDRWQIAFPTMNVF